MTVPPEVIQALADIAAFFSMYAIVALALNLAYGYTGVPNFGLHMTILGGAAITGGLMGRVLFGALWGDVSARLTELGMDPTELDFVSNNAVIIDAINAVIATSPLLGIGILLMSLLVAGLFGALLGYLLTLPAARLREEYLAMATLAIAEVFFNVLRFQREIIGGTIGIQVVDPLAWLPQRFAVYPLILLGAAAAAFLLLRRVVNAPLGRVLKSVRDDDVAASTMGHDVARMRELSMAVSGFIGGVAGALWAFYTLGINAINFNRVLWTFIPWLIVILGGTANNLGVVIGALVYIVIRRTIILFKDTLNPVLPFDVAWVEYLLIGSLLIIMLIFRPQGILPERPVETLGREEVERLRGESQPSLRVGGSDKDEVVAR